MKWRTKWVLAIIVTIAIIGMNKLENEGVIRQPVTQYITSGKDFVAIKKWIASMIESTEPQKIVVSGEAVQEEPFSTYQSMQPYKDGVIASYAQALPVEAKGNGLVVFTGFTRQSGKTVTVIYDDGDEVTYGFVGTFSKLPYTAVKRGDTLAMMDDESTIFLMVKRDGIAMDASLLPTYFSGGEQ